MKYFLASCRELLFPSYCLGCERRLAVKRLPLFCDACLPSIPTIHAPRCNICGLPFDSGENHVCGACITKTPAFHIARAAVVYQPPIVSLISALKFKGHLTCLATLANLTVTSPAFQELATPDLILPVPLHKRRLRERGFNQSLLLADAFFKGGRHKIDTETLIRNRPTPPQTQLNRKERRKNISGAFSIIQPQKVINSRILLVDDVLTTGSTANECARVLCRAGAEHVEILTVARAV